MRKFNVTGLCVHGIDYMADIGGKLDQIEAMIDEGLYFTINRPRQYGKTTVLNALQRRLDGPYVVARGSFEGVGDTGFTSNAAFCDLFMRIVQDALAYSSVRGDEEYSASWYDPAVDDFKKLGRHITRLCTGRKVVLIIDEVDRTSGNRVFLNFIGMLRDKYLLNKSGKDVTFHSVILAGVYDIRNIKLKLINEGLYATSADENKLLNSPWNIAADFKVDLSLLSEDIASMLKEYEADYHTGMEIDAVSADLRRYTEGYPYLVSRLCKIIDEDLGRNWTADGVREAVTLLLKDDNTLFDDIGKNLEGDKELYDMLYDILIVGKDFTLSRLNPTMRRALMFGFIRERNGRAVVANPIFERLITEYFSVADMLDNDVKKIKGVFREDVVRVGRLDMELCLTRFARHYHEIFNEKDVTFLERSGRLVFITYLVPLINGAGFYHMESQLTNEQRMDIVVDYGADQFVVELKLWRGQAAHTEAYAQLAGYLEEKKAAAGYLLTFDFRKHKPDVPPEPRWVDYGGKRIFDVVL